MKLVEPRGAQITAQRSMEALRNGVPNTNAVRALGCTQPRATESFTDQLDLLIRSANSEPAVVPGTLIAGGFGSGKSHTLAWFEIEALQKNFIVSRLAISKETPLHSPVKLFLAAVREARLPDGRGSLLHELAMRIDYRQPRVNSFLHWVKRFQPYESVAATVDVHQHSQDPLLLEKIVGWWSGEKLGVSEVRNALKNMGKQGAYDVKAIRVVDLAPVRFEFAARYARAAGYAGWVILLDETELIAHYALLQRAKAYAELARWLGAVEGQSIPGVAAVAAITDDFAYHVLQLQGDRKKVGARLRGKARDKNIVADAMATKGLDLIETAAIKLNLPTREHLLTSHKRLSDLYTAAYSLPISHPTTPDLSVNLPIRGHIRRWISTWDLGRLYPNQELGIQTEEMPKNYDEDTEFEIESMDRASEEI